MLSKFRGWACWAGVLAAAALLQSANVFAQETVKQSERGRLSAAEIEQLHELIKPGEGESRWMEIDWYPNVWEARQKAAAEGKPLFLLAGSGGAPVAGC